MHPFILIVFPIAWLLTILAMGMLFPKRNRTSGKILLIYISFMAMIGPIGEVFVGTIYPTLFEHPLWHYQIMPIHNGYTSYYAPVIWGISGAFLFCIREVAGLVKPRSHCKLALIAMSETILLEVALNLTFLLMSGGLMFYYLPADLWHVTSLQTLPFYFVLGLITSSTLKRMRNNPIFYSAMCVLIMVVFVYMVR